MESLINLFSGFRWQDGLDILLNAYILFRLYVLFRGTNVFRGLLAICILWAIGQAAQTLGLIVTNWAMQGVIAAAALIIIIVFRNEISGVLQTKNFKSILWGIPRYQLNTPVQIIAQSVLDLAERKIGALIVLPVKQGVDSVVRAGTPIEGKLSRKLLVSIFWPDNPVHDGAVIIQGNRIKGAGAILPLSKREDLPPFFGTRHLAAAGVTERTDALVIVVSEERGDITVFKENNSHIIQARSDLETLLQENAGDESDTKGWMKHALELVTAGVICLFCVAGVWASFSKGMETLAEHEIPLEFINPDQKMEIISASASSVRLLVSGARPLINAIKPDQINIKMNLSRSAVGINTLDITRNNILLPPGISLKKIDPPLLEVTLDTLVEKELFIQPNWTGRLAKGLVMTKAVPVPEKIRVKGGGLALKDIHTIFTETISLNTLSESGIIMADLVLNPLSLKIEGSQRVEIQYLISER
ncbi:MAG: diadenylate cyclase [Desulfobacterales bacterium]|nr:diadenylate cyclase [Desulfobacterales bacterium]